MNVLIVSGIWPPDVGGPASHAPEVAAFLSSRGHRVAAAITAESAPSAEPYPVYWSARTAPVGVRHVLTGLEIVRRARTADVVDTTGMLGRSSLGAWIAGRPYVIKLTADPAYERARRRGLFAGSLDEFQRAPGGRQVRLLCRVRDAELRHAAHVVSPSAFLRDLTLRWGVPPNRGTVLPNPTPPVPKMEARTKLRDRLGVGDGPLIAFAGRLTTEKSLDVALAAVARNDSVTLLLAGDGPDRGFAERRAAELRLGGRARFLGLKPRAEVLELFAAADVAVLSSSWENFPHTVVEALAVGTPVIATAAGGVKEVVRDGENGLVVPVGDVEALAAAIERFFADAALRERLAAAAPSVASYAPEAVYGRLEEILLSAAGTQ